MAFKKSAPKKSSGKRASKKKAAASKPAVKKKVAGKQQVGKKVAATKPVAAKATEPAWPREGSVAPDFTAVAHDGSAVRLAALKGRPVVLYFYPKDDTPGCTVEACGFRDAHARFARHKAVVLGVSPDSGKSHLKFREKYGLPFTLLVDESHSVAEKYGAWREKSMYGKKYMGIARSTFVIDAAGRIAKAFTSVKPQGHEQEVLAAVAGLA
ncbi:MAG: putative peroxiredoxin bcp [Planctomycetota bacterium]|jgi:peroxiredoxin Q/BCP